jgi:hypothetical protein
VFPSLSDVVLQQLGLNATVATRPRWGNSMSVLFS